MLQNQQSNSLTLRPGQVMLGKIKEILPNNVAVVQFGKHQVVANLEVPITADQSYLFEVVTTGDLPQLSVVSQSTANISLTEQIQMILANLNLSPTTENRQFVQELLANEIPIRQSDLKQALDILKNNQTTETKELLRHLLKRQLPITEMTLNAVKSVRADQSIVSQMTELYQAIEQQPMTNTTTAQLLDILTQFINNESTTGQPVPLSNQQILELSTLLQQDSVPMINAGEPVQLGSVVEASSTTNINQSAELTFNNETIVDRMQSQMALTDKQLYQFNKVLTQIQSQEQAVSPRLMEQLQTLLKNTTVNQKIIQQLPNQIVTALQEFVAQPNQTSLTEFIQPLTTLIEHQLPVENSQQIFKLLARMEQANPDLFPIKEQFIIHVKNYLLNAGLDFEHQIIQEDHQIFEQSASLKQLILQSFAEQTSGGREAEQLLNHITGQQLNLINETASFLHLSTTIPGLLGQEQDIEIEFYSRKDENEKIDSDYCRIAFYLELDQLKTTMIDMNVQNRIVHLTVYNDRDISEQLAQFKPLLKQGLEKFNYQLSTTSYKPLPDKREGLAIKPEKNETTSQPSRWDVRI